MLAKIKLNSIKFLVSQALIDMKKVMKNLIQLQRRKKYEKMKENVTNVSEKVEEKPENMRLNSVNSRT